MTPNDFQPTAFTTPDGSLRVYREGALWYADVRGESGDWYPVVQHQLSAFAAQHLALVTLGVMDDPPDETDAPDLDW